MVPLIARDPNKRLVELFITEIFEKRHISDLPHFVDERIVAHIPYYPSRLKGIDRYQHFIQEYYNAFPSPTVTINELIAEEERVAVLWYIKGKHVGEFMNVPTAGPTIKLYIMCFHHFKGGKISETWMIDSGFWPSLDF